VIVRSIICCGTCHKKFLLRVSLGHNEKHSHRFECPSCNELMELSVHLNFENGNINFECKTNCLKVEDDLDEDKLTIINLHPDFIIPEEKIHDKNYFPSIEYNYKIMLKQREMAGGEDLSLPIGSVKAYYDSSNTYYENWKIIKTSWSLSIKGRNELAKQKIKEYRSYGFNVTDNVNEVLFHFINIFLSPYKNELLHNILESSKSVFGGDEFKKFINYYNSNLKHAHYQLYYEIFCEYFKFFEEFSQVINHIKYDIEITNHHATSRDFSRIKMFYGNCYEILTNSLIIPSCMNNILSSRTFDQFKNMSLDKYITLSKTSRAKNFSQNKEFSVLSSHLNNKIRNASHHQNIALDGKYLKYRTKGDGVWHKMTYEDYLIQCNLIFFDICRLFQYELVITGQP